MDYTYDPVGNLLTKTDSGGTITYRYDPNDQVTSLTDRGGRSYTVGYDADGNQTSVLFPNAVTESRSYNSVGQLAQITAVTSTQQTLTSFTYNYTNPATSQPTTRPYSITDVQGNMTSYTYDVTNELTQALKRNSGGSTLAT